MGKGQDFERDIAKQLSLWLSEGSRDDVFGRTAGSGARATTRAKKGIMTENSAGDICYIDPLGKDICDYFLIELKRGFTKQRRMNYDKILNVEDKTELKKAMKSKRSKGIDPLDFIDSNSICILQEWIEKAEEQSKIHKKESFLIIFKRDGKVPCVLFTNYEFLKFKNLYGDIQKNIKINNKYIIITLNDFFNWVNPNTFKNHKLKLKLKQ